MNPVDWLVTVYILALSGLALYGCLGLFTLTLFWRHRHTADALPTFCLAELPLVTIQLPLYNERYVVERLIGATTTLRYPPERLQIQVIDDSTDDTTERAASLVAHYQRQGVNIVLLHRTHREGYKAGALAEALEQAQGEFVAIFDADFQPEPDFLYQTIPHFLHRPKLGMVQARWGHLNPGVSSLTRAQALALDKHFVVEQTVRHRADLFPKFNGTAGVWRRQCVVDAGGWQADTVCEDLCLSTRAILKGWHFQFLPDVVAPAELPTTASAYKNQQARWARGSTQCLLKFGWQILGSKHQSRTARLYALLSMGAYATSLLLILLLLVQVPLIYLDYRFPARMMLFSIAGFGQPLLFLISQQVLYPDWWRRLHHFPLLFLTAIGLSATISRAVIGAVVAREHPFIRTPKQGEEGSVRDYRLSLDGGILLELLLAAYAAGGLVLALLRGNYGPAFFLASCFLGFSTIAFLTWHEQISPS